MIEAAEPERWFVANVKREIDEPLERVRDRAASTLGVAPEQIVDWGISKRSIDARGRRAPRFLHVVELEVVPGAVDPDSVPGNARRAPQPEVEARPRLRPDAARPVVVGMGPCGLFAALQLAEAGLKPIVIDRGKPVETRAKDVARLMGRGEIDPDSNLCFGEGGAGTWSDGKLYTRVGGPRVREVLESLVDMGAPGRILVDGRPHLGTDRLVALLKAFRAALTELGCTLRFEARVERIEVRDGDVCGVRLASGEVIDATHVILAVGHSARDVYDHLAEVPGLLTPKPFAVGFRIEHPQRAIDEIQYGRWAEREELPAAYYELSANLGTGDARRGVFSFCMCPGGSIVPTPTHEGEVCVNGMSHAARSGKYANSAVVVQVEPRDIAEWGTGAGERADVLAGVTFQASAERAAWDAGGGAFVAPAQRVTDFLARRISPEIRRTTYKRGVTSADLRSLYPDPVIRSLDAALAKFDEKMPGYLTEEAVLVGVETRTSAPVTVNRDRQTLRSPLWPSLIPAGEGAGFGGGIVSAAIDGIRAAQAVIDPLIGKAAKE